MKSLCRRDLLLLAALVTMFLMIPALMAETGVRAPGVEVAHAGGDVDLSSVPIQGMCSDGKIYNGETISVLATSLGAAYGMSGSDFLAMVNNGELDELCAGCRRADLIWHQHHHRSALQSN